MQVSNGGIVNVGASGSIGTTIHAAGHLELNGGLFRTYQLTNNGLISGTGELSVQVGSPITNNGRIQADAGDLLRLTGTFDMLQNFGIVAADGGEIQIHRGLTNSPTTSGESEITLRDGTVRFVSPRSSSALANSSVLAAIGGENDFFGTVTNNSNGTIAITNHSVLIFHDDVTSAGEVTVFPGSTAVFLEDLTMSTGSVLQADLAGTNQDSGFGEVEVAGTATLSGGFAATLASGYTPQVGDTFPLIAAGAITGSLSLGAMPVLPNGLMWDLDVVANRMLLSVVPGLAGDYNGNGKVDTADYLLWRLSVDQTGVDLPADGDSNGKVEAADYDFWRSRFGNSLTGGAAIAMAVPEPASITMLFAALALVLRRGGKVR